MLDNKNEKTRDIVLGAIDFLYSFSALVLINPSLYYDSATQTYTGGYTASAIVFVFGIICPIFSRLIKGDIPKNKLLRIADALALLFSILAFCGIMLYSILKTGSWVIWASYILAALASGSSLFSLILALREYMRNG